MLDEHLMEIVIAAVRVPTSILAAVLPEHSHATGAVSDNFIGTLQLA